ncbi:MAG: hypothetical protein KDA62_08725 [Planctomycetales bacterium]|nr:hypothetical protein [Planctomycetales bacterium]
MRRLVETLLKRSFRAPLFEGTDSPQRGVGMAGMMDSIDRINSWVRTTLAAIVVGAAGWAGWFGYTNYTAGERAVRDLDDARAELVAKDEELATLSQDLQAKQATLVQRDRQIADQVERIQQQDDTITQQVAEIEQQQKEIDWLDTALRLMKVTHRVAHLRVLDQTTDEATGRKRTTVEFVEVSDGGQPLEEPRSFTLDGDVVFIDSWIVKFDDQYIEQADQDRSTSLVLFRRIFGEYQEPNEGFELDQRGTRPTAYARGGRESEFEKKIWGDFWQIANDSSRAKEMGIRAAHGNAISIKAMPDRTYRITLRASGDLSFQPEMMAPAGRN